MPKIMEGSLGETGIGWWMTSMRSCLTARRIMRRWIICVSRRIANPVVKYDRRLGRGRPSFHRAMCSQVSGM